MGIEITGVWQNSYGSKMSLQVGEDGGIVGEYSSTTGSSGVYSIVGFCQPDEPTATQGQSLIFSLFWHPVDMEKPDESWHWVSTMCGQLQFDGIMSVVHSLVATTAFGGFIPGDYIDKLAFHKISDHPVLSSSGRDFSHFYAGIETENPMNGQWCDASQKIQLTLSVIDSQYGLVRGTLLYANEVIALLGFTDTYVGHKPMQSISVCGYMANHKIPVSLSGYLEIVESTLSLSRWLANATTPVDSYLQANAAHWILHHYQE